MFQLRILINYFLKEDGLRLITLNTLQDIFLVSIGAVFGVNTRFLIYQKLKEININGHLIIMVINTFSSFFLNPADTKVLGVSSPKLCLVLFL